MTPTRRKPARTNIRDDGPIRLPSHLQWVRGHNCIAADGSCAGKIEAAHVRLGSHAGMGQKPGDDKTVPLCAYHHAYQHAHGEKTFWAIVGEDPHRIADGLWAKSPHRLKLVKQGTRI